MFMVSPDYAKDLLGNVRNIAGVYRDVGGLVDVTFGFADLASFVREFYEDESEYESIAQGVNDFPKYSQSNLESLREAQGRSQQNPNDNARLSGSRRRKGWLGPWSDWIYFLGGAGALMYLGRRNFISTITEELTDDETEQLFGDRKKTPFQKFLGFLGKYEERKYDVYKKMSWFEKAQLFFVHAHNCDTYASSEVAWLVPLALTGMSAYGLYNIVTKRISEESDYESKPHYRVSGKKHKNVQGSASDDTNEEYMAMREEERRLLAEQRTAYDPEEEQTIAPGRRARRAARKAQEKGSSESFDEESSPATFITFDESEENHTVVAVDPSLGIKRGPIAANARISTTFISAESQKSNTQFALPDVHPIIDTHDGHVVGCCAVIGSYFTAPAHVMKEFPSCAIVSRLDAKPSPQHYSMEVLGMADCGDIQRLRKPGVPCKAWPVQRLRAPRENEALIFVSIDPQDRKTAKCSYGVAIRPISMDVGGVGKGLLMFGFTGTTFNHQCGGVYIAQQDGYLVGFHGSGTAGDGPNYFYPVTQKTIDSFQQQVPPSKSLKQKPEGVLSSSAVESVYTASKVAPGPDGKRMILVRPQGNETPADALARIKAQHGDSVDYFVDDRYDPKRRKAESSNSNEDDSIIFNTKSEMDAFLLGRTQQ
jgi:hypothetical protein